MTGLLRVLAAALGPALAPGVVSAGLDWSDPTPPCPPADLRCIDLFPTGEGAGASGRADLLPVPSPFGASVDAEGRHRWVLALRIEGLPEPGELGPFAAYVAWAATPVLDPVIRLGEVGNGESRVGPVALDQFVVLVTAEPSPSAERPSGPAVLRGTSPSMALQPHELPAMLSVAAGGGDGHEGHAGGGPAEDGWTPPPEHPVVTMPPGLHPDRPDVAPFLPEPGAAGLPPALPPRVVRLADGDSIELVAAPVRKTIAGREHAMYAFNGRIPGPTLRVRQGASITVRFTNRTAMPTAIHWHGIRLDNEFDGVPQVTQEPIPPGGSFRYVLRFPDAGMFWYHPHHREDALQDLGLAANLLVEPRDPGAWPEVDREQILLLDDILIGEGGLVPYGREAATHALMGRFGNVLLVNGEREYRLTVAGGEVVRFFLTNASGTRTFNLSFGTPVRVVASDVGPLERSETVETVVIGPAERWVVEARFDEPGEVALTNRVQGIDHLYGRFFPEVDTLGAIAVSRTREPDVNPERAGSARRQGPDLEAYRRHFDRPVDVELALAMEADDLPFPLGLLLRSERSYFHPIEWSGTMPLMNWSATGRRVRWILRDPESGKENMDIAWTFQEGDVVKLRIVNGTEGLHAMQHPIHLHGQRFLVLSQEGVRKENLVWKDTVLVPAGGAAVLLLDLSNPGDWMLHCHIAEHLEAGMHTVIRVEPR